VTTKGILMEDQARRRFVILFLTPAVALYALFVLFPVVRSFQYSLFLWRGVSANMRFVGLKNFATILTADKTFWQCLFNNVQYFLITLALVLPFSLLLAALLTKNRDASTPVYRVIFFAPNVMSLAAVAILWTFIYNPILGLLNGMLKAVGLESWTKPWLVEAAFALPAISLAEVWRLTGFYMLLFMAGMRNISKDLYESAVIEGASELRQFFSITLPMLSEQIQIAVVFLVINGLNVFVLPQIMTDGGPGRRTQTAALYMYEHAFKNSRFGYASAMGLVLFVIIFGLSYLSLRLTRRQTIEY
jgi:N-acetylglucosamine transport system permease protein